jgi:hypothetical protein
VYEGERKKREKNGLIRAKGKRKKKSKKQVK